MDDNVGSSKRRRHGLPRRSGGYPSPGRRSTDYDTRTTLTKKVIVVTVVVVDALYLVGEALLFGQSNCL